MLQGRLCARDSRARAVLCCDHRPGGRPRIGNRTCRRPLPPRPSVRIAPTRLTCQKPVRLRRARGAHTAPLGPPPLTKGTDRARFLRALATSASTTVGRGRVRKTPAAGRAGLELSGQGARRARSSCSPAGGVPLGPTLGAALPAVGKNMERIRRTGTARRQGHGSGRFAGPQDRAKPRP